jgi:hypothetical protein
MEMAIMVTSNAAIILMKAAGQKSVLRQSRMGIQHTGTCQPRYLAQSPRQCTYHRDDETDNSKDNRASSVVGQGVHHRGESQDMTTHNEYEKEELGRSEELSTEAWKSNSTKHYFTCICHAVNLGVSHFELADDIAGVGCGETEPDNENHRTR